MVTVPERAAPLFAAAARLTAPLPEPLLLEVIVTNEALLVSLLQAHPAGATTFVNAVPPVPGNAAPACVREYVQEVPDCVTV
jgi:hypothetical protein